MKRRRLFEEACSTESVSAVPASPGHADACSATGIEDVYDSDIAIGDLCDKSVPPPQCASCASMSSELPDVKEKLNAANSKIVSLESELSQLRPRVLSVATIKEKPYFVPLFTGLANINMFLWILSLVLDCSDFEPLKCKDMSTRDQLLSVLVKIKLGLSHGDLAMRFGVSKSVISRVFRQWVPVLGKTCRAFIIWPDRDTNLLCLPMFFIKHFSSVRSIIDCFEIFIDRPTLLKSRAQTWSNYKHHQTLKYLISIGPNGLITFMSEGWGGRTSDKHITQHCGNLNMLECGDVVMADRGFIVRDDMDLLGVKLIMPAFTRVRKQLTKKEVDESRMCARRRIHVERVIRKVKQYKILQGVISINLMELIDDCVTIAAPFVNLDVGVVKVT